jgi:membrane protein
MLSHLKTAAGRPYLGLAAAGIAYYAFLALVPLLASIILLYGIWADPETIGAQIGTVTSALPGAAGELVGTQMVEVASGDSSAQGLGLIASLALSLFAARGGATALIDGLDLAYRTTDDRGFIKRNVLALLVTLAAAIGFGLVAAVVAFAGLSDGIAADILLYALMAGAMTFAAAFLYRKVPDRDPPAFAETLPGAVFFALVWLLATAGFGIYVANFGRYDATYGSLGAIVVLLTWMWLSAYVLLIGAAFNAERQGSG